MNDIVLLRKKLRAVLALAPTFRQSEQMILDALGGMMPEPVSHAEFAEALNWNHARGLVEYRFNEDADRREWFLTDAGKQKEGL